jgi:hypothetical protein
MPIDFTAHLYELTEWKPRRSDVLKPFAGKFFRGPINTSTLVCDLGELGGVIGTLYAFFSKGVIAPRVIVVLSKGSDQPLGEPDARGVLGQFVGPTHKEAVSRVFWARGSLEQQRSGASLFLRESGSLTESEFEPFGNLYVASDAKGVGVIDVTPHPLPPGERAERLAALCALVFAYRSVLDDAIDLLAVAGQDSRKSPEQQLRDWSKFMSSYYFHEPIKLTTIELARFYGAVRDRHKIFGLALEVTDQLKLLAELVRLDRSESQLKRDKGLQLRISAVGVLLAIIGVVLSSTQVTPKALADAFKQWDECEKTGGYLGCVLGGYKEPVASATSLTVPKPLGPPKKFPVRP